MRLLLVRGVLRCVSGGLILAAVAVVLALVSALGAVFIGYSGTGTLPADCAVVFGAAVYNERPGPAVVRRVATATALYRAGKIRTLFLTGGKGGQADTASEAMVMFEQAVEQGVDPDDIVLEGSARSTWENLLFTRRLTSACESVVGISDKFHLARIRLLAGLQGWHTLETIPSEGRPLPRLEARSIVREVLGYLYYTLRMNRIIEVEDAEPLTPRA